MKAIGYIRVSTEDQAKEGVSLDNQEAKIRTYADLKDLELVEIVEDAGISAKNLKRPGAQKVLKMARRKEVAAVIVYKLDRMFRSTIDALETTKMFDRWGVAFHSINETLDTQSAMGRFFFTLTAALAEMERGIIGERTKAALKHKRLNGKKTGGDVPFGYYLDVDGQTLMEDRKEQEVISLIKELRHEACSLKAICQELKHRGLPTKTGKENWHPQSVSRILKRHDSSKKIQQ
ncbi:MAG: recombinase family protein [Desulfobacterales bacterium]|nr:recombinase family protein [Desulfobacterales bacterium]